MVSTEPKDFCKRLLRIDPGRRLGCSYEGSAKVKAHPFFKGMKWDALLEKQLGQKEGAIVPKVASALDSSAYLNKQERKEQEIAKEEEERKAKALQGREDDSDEEKEGEAKDKGRSLGEAEWEFGSPPWGDEYDPFESFSTT